MRIRLGKVRLMRHEENLMVLVFGTGICLVLLWIFGRFIALVRMMFGPRIPEEMPDQISEALRVVSAPMPLPGGRWGMYETKLVECPAPMQATELIVHNKQDPRHVAQCPECRDGRKMNYSGVSYRSN